MVHDAVWSIAAQEKRDSSPFWRGVYDCLFPDRISVRKNRDLTLDKKGIDFYIDMPGGVTVTVENKERSTWYGDFLFEIWSDYERYDGDEETGSEAGAGWTRDKLECDWFIYAVTNRRFYAFKYDDWWSAWVANRNRWFDLAEAGEQKYRWRDARNIGLSGRLYTTRSLTVPEHEWLSACPYYVSRIYR